MSVSIQRDLRDAFECAMRKDGRRYDFTLDNGTYQVAAIEKLWLDFCVLGIDVLVPQGRA